MREAAFADGRHQNGATTGSLSSLPGQIAQRYRAWKARRRIVKMTDLDDRILDDIGVSRDDLYAVLTLPLSQNPAFELQRISRRNRSRWVRI
jgi:uncharacterized protein YjiS (DUF1127 family)